MLFKNKKNEKNGKNAVSAKKNIENLTNEVTKIWNGSEKSAHTDVSGSYTGNPIGYEIPEQDSDDL